MSNETPSYEEALDIIRCCDTTEDIRGAIEVVTTKVEQLETIIQWAIDKGLGTLKDTEKFEAALQDNDPANINNNGVEQWNTNQ